MSSPKVTFVRPELSAVSERYKQITDCLIGEDAVKARRTEYLPMPNETDKSEENRVRYKQYLRRAVFVNVVRRTLNGLSGQVFARDPVSEIPDAMDIIEVDANGGGVSLVQTAKRALNMTLSYGRGGTLVDYPDVAEGGATKREQAEGLIRPTISVHAPQNVINWRTITRGSKVLLSLVVIAETWPMADDGFEIKTACQFRVLELVGNKYRITIYRENVPTAWNMGQVPPKSKNFSLNQEFWPKDASGVNFDEIPFMFFGSENNDDAVDNPPMADMCVINLAHYRNSADYEEATYILGQPTYVVAGLDKSWVDDVMKGKINSGSTGGIMLPSGGTAQLLQASPNTMAKEAMDQKETLMIAIGAKFVELSVGSRKTATEAQHEETSETSFLASTANNVTAMIEWALNWCAKFMGIEPGEIKYKLNTDFDITKMSPEARKQLMAEWQGGMITWKEARALLRKSGIATEDDDAAKEEIDNEQADSLKKMVDENKALGLNNPDAKIPPPKPKG